uniref:Uncharacterized protein n=1 Tax=Ditylenchus dipsaci TaxID=166011 RepID=A0A915ED31_9BILA
MLAVFSGRIQHPAQPTKADLFSLRLFFYWLSLLSLLSMIMGCGWRRSSLAAAGQPDSKAGSVCAKRECAGKIVSLLLLQHPVFGLAKKIFYACDGHREACLPGTFAVFVYEFDRAEKLYIRGTLPTPRTHLDSPCLAEI